MSLNLLYTMREGVIGLKRARLATLAAVATMGISLTLLGLFVVFTYNVQRIVEELRQKMAMEVFINNGLDEGQISQLEEAINAIEGVASVHFITKEEALRRCREELGLDPVALYGENNLPQSFQLTLARSHRSARGVETVVAALESIDGVDEVVDHGRLFHAVDRYSRIILLVDAVLFFIVFMAAVFLVGNTARLAILSQKRTIHIMELVGATESFIHRPYLIQGILQGGIGGCFASLVVWLCVRAVVWRFPNLLVIPFFLIFLPLGLGLLMGFVGSREGLRRFIKA